VAAETQRNHREPNNDHGGGHSGDADLFSHCIRLAAYGVRRHLYVRTIRYTSGVHPPLSAVGVTADNGPHWCQ
jgi:hypothetical protein